MSARAEILLPFSRPREQVPPVRHWRSTWVVSSLQTLKERGHYDRYLRELAPAHRDAVLLTVAATWLPLEAARAHYEACNALGLGAAEQIAMGRAVGQRAQGSVLGTAVRAARGAGVTPWTAVPLLPRLWARGADGGDTQVTKLGPKESRVEAIQCALFEVPYFRRAFAGVLLGIHELFVEKVYVHDDTPPTARNTCVLRFQWV